MSAAATVAGDARLRLFLALELPTDVTTALRVWAERELERGRLVQTYHVTLAFLGAQPRDALGGITEAMDAEAAATGAITLAPRSYRETRSVGMLVLSDAAGEATALAERLHARLERLGVYRRERRPWLPHVTVLRFREQPRLDPPLPELGPFAPSGVAAFLSRLHPSGARYEVLNRCSLGS